MKLKFTASLIPAVMSKVLSRESIFKNFSIVCLIEDTLFHWVWNKIQQSNVFECRNLEAMQNRFQLLAPISRFSIIIEVDFQPTSLLNGMQSHNLCYSIFLAIRAGK